MRTDILTLTTDFGSDGPYVAAMKGVILGMAPHARFVDVSHAISPQNILEGAFVLASVIEAFPAGTVHLAVVDPGVGTNRRLVAVRSRGHWFVAPDNGLIAGVLRDAPIESIYEIANPEIRRPRVSSTFHGRDILAPAAAHLLLGRDPAALGPARESIERLAWMAPKPDDHGLIGEVIYRDRFGNLITNVSAEALGSSPPDRWSITIGRRTVHGISRTYGESPPGTLVALIGSSGWVELAVVNGDAGQSLEAGPGTTVLFRRMS